MKVTAIIPTLNRHRELFRCLETLRAQTRKPDQLAVVDGAKDPAIAQLVLSQKGAFADVIYLAFHSGLTEARNHGLQHTDGDVVVFLDDDLLLEPEFIAELIRPLQEDAAGTVAGVGGDITNHVRDGSRFQQCFKRFFQLPYDGDGRFRLSGAPTMVYGTTEERDVEFLPGGVTAWRREIFSEFRFDETLKGIGVNEDVDFSYRVSRKWRNRFNPKARVAHHRPETSIDRDSSLRHLFMEYAGYWHLYKKNQPKDPFHFTAFLWHGVGVLLRHLFRRVSRLLKQS